MEKGFSLGLLFFSYFVFSQIPDIEFSMNYGGTQLETPSRIIRTSDNGYLLVGDTSSNDYNVNLNKGNSDFFIVKTDLLGNLLWTKTYGGSGYDGAMDVIEVENNNYIIIGNSNSTDGDKSVSLGFYDVWVIKINGIGDLIWEKTFGGSGHDYASQIINSHNNNFVISSISASNDYDVAINYGGFDVWIFEIDNLGNLIWGKNYGGTSDEIYQPSIMRTDDTGYIFTCGTTSNDYDISDVPFGNEDLLLIKINETGNLIWQKCYGGSGFDCGTNIIKLSDGNFLISGYTESFDGDFVLNPTNGDSDSLLLKIDNMGNIIWQKCYGGSSWDSIEGRGSLLEIQGYYYFSSYILSNNGDVTNNYGFDDGWLCKIDVSGNLIWEQNFGGTLGDGQPILVSNNDDSISFLMPSSSIDNDIVNNYGNNDFILIKLNSENLSSQNFEFLFKIYPNPTTDRLFVEGKDFSLEHNFKVFDLVGKVIMSGTLRKETSVIDVEPFKKGVYFLSIEGEESYKFKFIKN